MDGDKPSSARWLSPRRVALGLSENAAPSFAFVAIGIIIGPEVLDVVSDDVLAQFDPFVSIALAMLGVFIASGYIAVRGAGEHRWIIGASIQALITVVSVTAAMYFLLERWALPSPLEPLMAAAVLGICSAASAAVRVSKTASATIVNAAHLANLDDVTLVILGSVAVPIVAGAASPLVPTSLAIAAGLIIAVAGSLLFRRSENAPEYGVFVIGSVLLLGGAAAYLRASPLTTGCVAGLWWARQRTSLMEFELSRLQQPVVALLLILAGASVQLSYALLWITIPLILFRISGKLIASLAVARSVKLPPGLVGTVLVPPGILGIALALNFQQVISAGSTLLVSAVTLATVVSETLLLALPIHEDSG